MKRAMPWNDNEDGSSPSDSESSSSSDAEAEGSGDASKSKQKDSLDKPGRRKPGAFNYEALAKHGYKGGPSVLSVPAPQEESKPNWNWSSGEEHRKSKEVEESYEDRLKTRAALLDGEQLANVQTSKEKKNNMSFSQKEKRKRDFGQASRGKNYVEEEKRLLRDSGVYSGFDA